MSPLAADAFGVEVGDLRSSPTSLPATGPREHWGAPTPSTVVGLGLTTVEVPPEERLLPPDPPHHSRVRRPAGLRRPAGHGPAAVTGRSRARSWRAARRGRDPRLNWRPLQAWPRVRGRLRPRRRHRPTVDEGLRADANALWMVPCGLAALAVPLPGPPALDRHAAATVGVRRQPRLAGMEPQRPGRPGGRPWRRRRRVGLVTMAHRRGRRVEPYADRRRPERSIPIPGRDRPRPVPARRRRADPASARWASGPSSCAGQPPASGPPHPLGGDRRTDRGVRPPPCSGSASGSSPGEGRLLCARPCWPWPSAQPPSSDPSSTPTAPNTCGRRPAWTGLNWDDFLYVGDRDDGADIAEQAAAWPEVEATGHLYFFTEQLLLGERAGTHPRLGLQHRPGCSRAHRHPGPGPERAERDPPNPGARRPTGPPARRERGGHDPGLRRGDRRVDRPRHPRLEMVGIGPIPLGDGNFQTVSAMTTEGYLAYQDPEVPPEFEGRADFVTIRREPGVDDAAHRGPGPDRGCGVRPRVRLRHGPRDPDLDRCHPNRVGARPPRLPHGRDDREHPGPRLGHRGQPRPSRSPPSCAADGFRPRQVRGPRSWAPAVSTGLSPGHRPGCRHRGRAGSLCGAYAESLASCPTPFLSPLRPVGPRSSA